MNHLSKGFTLIELLIVIAVLAILSTVVVLVLNPAQMLAQARDSQRLSDLGSVSKAIIVYLATTTSTPAIAVGPYSTFGTTTSTCPFGTCTVPSAANLVKVNGTGWVAVDLRKTSGGSSLGALPIDPLNNSTSSQYSIKANTALTFKITGVLESKKYLSKMAADGGSLGPNVYEVGTNLSIN